MSSLSTTYTFSANTTANSGEVNQDFSDVVNYINVRNSGATSWDGLSVSGTTALVGTFTLTGNWDGWIGANETWTYASATTFTISGDLTGKYQTGDKIKLTQTTAKYFSVVGVSYSAPNTTVTVTGGSDYTLANAAISSPYFSKMESPQGFPQWFNTSAPTWNASNFDDASGGQPTTTISRFKITGRTVTVYLRGTGTKATTNKYINFNPSSVYPAASTTAYASMGSCYEGSSDGIGSVIAYNSTTDWYFIFAANIPDNSSLANGVSGLFSYQI